MKYDVIKDSGRCDSVDDICMKKYQSSRKSQRKNIPIRKRRRYIKLMENKIQSEKAHSDKLSRIADMAFDNMEKNQQKLKEQLTEKELELKKFKDDVDAFANNKLSMQKQIDELKRKGEQFDAIQENLSRIHKKAHFDAQDLIDAAKEQSMDILGIVDDLIYEMDIFKNDIRKIIKDLSIGPATTEDRLKSILYAVKNLEDRIIKARLDFYEENDIPR